MTTNSLELKMPIETFRQIEAWALAAYPHEGCGLLLGRFKTEAPQKEAVRFVPLKNILLSANGKPLEQRIQESGAAIPLERAASGGGRTEFLMDPTEFERTWHQAEKQGQDVIGIVHTHPDHPPKPSPMDASQPMLASWSNLIITVKKGKDIEARSWIRADDESPFQEEHLVIEG